MNILNIFNKQQQESKTFYIPCYEVFKNVADAEAMFNAASRVGLRLHGNDILIEGVELYEGGDLAVIAPNGHIRTWMNVESRASFIFEAHGDAVEDFQIFVHLVKQESPTGMVIGLEEVA